VRLALFLLCEYYFLCYCVYYIVGTPYSAEDCATYNPDLQTHKYNGKEFDTTHGLNTYDYGARQYNSLVDRWDRIDPLCEKYYSVSPYVYCANNPVLLIDEGGKEIYLSGTRAERLAVLL
jgi:RHS repeat-associated protein